MLVFVLWDLRGKGAGMLRRRCEGSARDGEAGGHEGGAPQSGATSVQRRIRLARSPTRGVREVWTYTRWTAGWVGGQATRDRRARRGEAGGVTLTWRASRSSARCLKAG